MYEARQKTLASRQMTNIGRSSRIVNRSDLLHPLNVNRLPIPAIAITKETPSDSIQPGESYSEEEFEASMKPRLTGAYGQLAHKRGAGISPIPPQRTRIISEFEKSNFGPYNQSGYFRRGQQAGQQQQRGGGLQREHGVRWFVALFDYDPLSMSPNPDAAEEELPFQEGQLIKVRLVVGQLKVNYILGDDFFRSTATRMPMDSIGAR